MKDLKRIKLIISDCDGVLTDGKIIYNDQRIETRNFSARDGLGIKMLIYSPIIFAVISGKSSPALSRRCEDLGIKHVFQGIKNKVQVAKQLSTDLNIKFDEIAFIGDDWNDFLLMKEVQFCAMPAAGCKEMQLKVDYVSEIKGGCGAVRDIIEYILKEQGIYGETLEKLLHDLQNSDN